MNRKEIQSATFGMSFGRRTLGALEFVTLFTIAAYIFALLAAISVGYFENTIAEYDAFSREWFWELQSFAIPIACIAAASALLVATKNRECSIFLYRFYTPTPKEVEKYKNRETEKIQRKIKENIACIEELEKDIQTKQEEIKKNQILLEKVKT